MTDAGAKADNSSSGSSGLLPIGHAGNAAAILGSSGSSAVLTARQELVLSNLVRVLTVINQHVAKQEEDRTTDFL